MYRTLMLTSALLATSTSLAQTKTTPQAFNALLQTYGARAVAYTGKGCVDVTLFNVSKADQKKYDKAIKDMLAF